MSNNIEKRRNLWYAVLKVLDPKAQEVLRRKRFLQSLGTPDKRKAIDLARPVVALWKAQIREALGEPCAVQTEALRWRESLKEIERTGDGDYLSDAHMVLQDHAEAIAARHGDDAAARFAGVALGERTPSALHVEAWKASISHLEAKTRDGMVKAVEQLTKRFEALEEMKPDAVHDWVGTLKVRTGEPITASAIKRLTHGWRSFWKFNAKRKAVPLGAVDPFSMIELPKQSKREKAESGWLPFPANGVVRLAEAAAGKGDATLCDLIHLAAYSGARIEELCALELVNVREGHFSIADSKTEAGYREVPIHASIAPLVKRLRAQAEDAKSLHLLPGLKPNKWGDRSDAIGKRFGRLKTAQGYGKQHVFHSIRKTFVTQLENAGISENLAADIVGHEKPRITYGLYSGGATLAVKAEAVALVKYPGLA